MDLYSHRIWDNGWYNGRRNERHNIDYISWIYIYIDIYTVPNFISTMGYAYIYIIIYNYIYTHWGYPLLLSNMVGREFPEAVIWIWQSSSQMANCRWGRTPKLPRRSQNMNTMVLLPWTACSPWLQFSNILDFFKIIFFAGWTQMQSRVWQVCTCLIFFWCSYCMFMS